MCMLKNLSYSIISTYIHSVFIILVDSNNTDGGTYIFCRLFRRLFRICLVVYYKPVLKILLLGFFAIWHMNMRIVVGWNCHIQMLHGKTVLLNSLKIPLMLTPYQDTLRPIHVDDVVAWHI